MPNEWTSFLKNSNILNLVTRQQKRIFQTNFNFIFLFNWIFFQNFTSFTYIIKLGPCLQHWSHREEDNVYGNFQMI
jgi:hypothetical protein